MNGGAKNGKRTTRNHKSLGGEIQLTEEGRKQGEIITTKFQVIYEFLITCCDVNELIASTDACKIEHIISNDAILALKKYLGLVQGDAL